VLVLNPDFLDGAIRGPHPIDNTRAFEGGAGRAGARHQPVTVSEHDFAVVPMSNEKRDGLRFIQPARKHAGGNVCAHVAGNTRAGSRCGLGGKNQAQFAGSCQRWVVD